jgi:hypothetical protein
MIHQKGSFDKRNPGLASICHNFENDVKKGLTKALVHSIQWFFERIRSRT